VRDVRGRAAPTGWRRWHVDASMSQGATVCRLASEMANLEIDDTILEVGCGERPSAERSATSGPSQCPRRTATVNDVTRILSGIEQGDRQAADQLLPLVYDELRKLAAARLAAENPGQTLDATALVHEAYLRLVGDQRFDGRGHFFAAAAEAMRRILVNHARDRKRLKRAGGRVRLDLLDQIGSLAEDPDLVLSLDELLTRLGQEDPVSARVGHLHLFGGLSVEEAGEVLALSRAVAYRNWRYARAWLRQALGE
jgi:RNA polymerase sigma factor (TIGR02999 family)